MTKFKQTEIGKIPEDWEIKSIDEIKASMAMGPFGSNIKKEFFVEMGVPVIRGNNLTRYKFYDDEFGYVSEKKADELKSSNCFPGDIVITHRGTLGQVGIIPRNSRYKRYVISQSGMKLSCNESVAINEYVFYFLKSAIGQYLLLQNTSQTGVPAIARPLTSLKRVSLPIPKIEEQLKIIRIMDALNDRIDLLQKQNKTLEEMAQAIFKHWFVDFEFPDENGKSYKTNGRKMVDSELGKIPDGWKTSKIGNILTTVLGGTPSRVNDVFWINGSIAWINSGKVNEFRIITPSEYITKEGLDNSATKMLPRRTTVIAITGATLGQVSLTEIDCCANQSVIGIIPSKQIPAEYIYCWIKKNISELLAMQTGGAQQHINKEDINNLQILIPTISLIKKYAEIESPIFDKISENCFETERIAHIRDSLLPKLMSGYIRVV